jgi:hypothetical protein
MGLSEYTPGFRMPHGAKEYGYVCLSLIFTKKLMKSNISRTAKQFPSAVRGMIIRVSDQLRCGEISLFEKDPEEVEAAKARLDALREKRRERHAKNKDRINARRREAYSSKKELREGPR